MGPLFLPEVVKNRQSDEEMVRVANEFRDTGDFAGGSHEDTATAFLTVREEPLERPQSQRKRERQARREQRPRRYRRMIPMSPRRWSAIAAAVVVVVGFGVGIYYWQRLPKAPVDASAQVQSAYRKELSFVPVVPAQLPQGCKTMFTEVHTDKTPIPTARLQNFYASYSFGKGNIVTLTEAKKNLPEPLNGIKTTQVKMYGTTVTVDSNPVIMQANFHVDGVAVSAALLSKAIAEGKGTNPRPSAGASAKPNVTKQRQALLSFVKNMVGRPAEVRATPTYTYAEFDGKYAVPNLPFRAVTPTAKTLNPFARMGTMNDPIAQIMTHGHNTLSSIFYLYQSGTEEITVEESQGAYQQPDGSWRRATDLGAVSRTITVDGQKVSLGSNNGPSMTWIENKRNVAVKVGTTSNVSQARLQKVMASIISQALATTSNG